MGLRIATNVPSLAAQRTLGSTNINLASSLEKLSSGSRIVKAADDAAGLAISSRMGAMIRSIGQNIRNSNDGISMIQTAEGGINEANNILTRFRELAIQSSSDTVGDLERGFIDKEVQQLKTELDRISVSTEFNGTKLLTGEGGVLEIQVGQRNDPTNDRFTFNTADTNIRLEHLGLGDLNAANKASAQESLEKIDSAMNVVNGNRANLGAMQNRLQSTVNNLSVYGENLSSAKSRIFDADMAAETSTLTKNQILSQAGISVLSQANQNNMQALKLLG